MSISVTDIRAGTLFEYGNGHTYRALKYEHIKIGRGGAIIKIRAHSIRNGTTQEFTFNSSARVEEIEGYRKNMEFVYFDKRRQKLLLTDPETKKRFEVNDDIVDPRARQFLKEGQEVSVLYLLDSDEIASLELPATLTLEVTEAPPAEKGNTAGAAKKPVTLETGAAVQAPIFIKVGDKIKINTQSGEYMERV